MNKDIKQVYHQAVRHDQAHAKLKKLVSQHNPVKERIFPVFLVTFIIVLLTILIFRNWDTIINLFQSEPQSQNQDADVKGASTGVVGNYKVDEQTNQDYQKLLTSIPTSGSVTGSEVNMAFGEERGEQPKAMGDALKISSWVTNYLSTGQQQTLLDQKNAKALQKSVISTYYLGEKTVDINSTLETDSKILSQMKNALSVDIFAYLNQSANRSDSLDEYLHLLTTMSDKATQRINDLKYKIDFLSANSQSKGKEITTSEKTFFDNLKIFDGPNADQELSKFVGLQGTQVEIRAKLGAYTSLQGYYKFFKPKLDNLIKTIQANRSALIAGVKVVEIQNMALPLIIQQK
jgi:hypothetical protein